MSGEHLPPDFLGIPVCTDAEVAEIQKGLVGARAEGGLTIKGVGYMFIDGNPEISRIIDHDVNVLKRRPEHRNLSADEMTNIELGVWDGYALFAGSIVWAQYLRSERYDPAAYVKEISGSERHPLLPRDTIVRIKSVRSGKAVMERLTETDTVKTSADWARRDAEAYFSESRPLDIALDDYVTELAGGTVPVSKNPYAFGIIHGIANAVEMFIQAHEDHTYRQKRIKLSLLFYEE